MSVDVCVCPLARGRCLDHRVDDAGADIGRSEPTRWPRPTRVCMRVFIHEHWCDTDLTHAPVCLSGIEALDSVVTVTYTGRAVA